MIAFHANRVNWSNDFGCTVVTLDEGGAGAEYLMFQRERENAGEPSNDAYLERRGQGWATRGGILRCELHRNNLQLRVNEGAAAQLGGESEFEVTFDLPPERFRSLQAKLRKVFRGLDCFADQSAGERQVKRLPDRFAQTLDRLFANWFGPPRPGDACSHDIVRDREKYSGFKLPAPLRIYYLRFGAHATLGRARGTLLTPDSLEMEDDHLVFWMGHKNDREGAWCSIRLDALCLPDPPVERQAFNSAGEAFWVLECRRLSWFLLRTMCWQAVWALAPRAVTEASAPTLERIAARLTLVAPEEPLDGEPLAYVGDGLAVCVIPQDGVVRIGALTTEKLQWLEGELGIVIRRT